MAPQVSIILPTHNRADILGYAIESALAQTLRDFELIVVGDGCTDETAAVVQGFDDKRVVWFDYPKSPGFGYANRNRGLRTARGENIAYLAHDDLWFPDHLERLVACLIESRAEIAYSRPLDVSMAGLIEPQIFNLHDSRTMRLWLTNCIGYLPLCCVIHRRACLDKYGFWDEQLPNGGDWDLWMRIIRGGQFSNFAYLSIPTTLHFVANYRRHETWKRKVWRRVRKLEGFGSPVLDLSVPPGVPEQHVAWNAIRNDPTGWMRDIRHAAKVDLDRSGKHRLALSGALSAAQTLWRRMH